MPVLLLKLIALVGIGIGVGILGEIIKDSNQHKEVNKEHQEKISP